jgi:hypothetical protein
LTPEHVILANLVPGSTTMVKRTGDLLPAPTHLPAPPSAAAPPPPHTRPLHGWNTQIRAWGHQISPLGRRI